MKKVARHFTRCIIAGIVAILPIGGTIVGIVVLERELADTWVARQPFYFPGLALLLTAAVLYVLGLVVSSFLGRWILKLVDSLLESLPALGKLYATVKQILGYGDGENAMFRDVVLVRNELAGSEELGLVTGEVEDAVIGRRLIVFVPGSPNPTTGRLILTERDRVRHLDIKVNNAFKTLLSVGTSVPTSGGENA